MLLDLNRRDNNQRPELPKIFYGKLAPVQSAKALALGIEQTEFILTDILKGG